MFCFIIIELRNFLKQKQLLEMRTSTKCVVYKETKKKVLYSYSAEFFMFLLLMPQTFNLVFYKNKIEELIY